MLKRFALVACLAAPAANVACVWMILAYGQFAGRGPTPFYVGFVLCAMVNAVIVGAAAQRWQVGGGYALAALVGDALVTTALLVAAVAWLVAAGA